MRRILFALLIASAIVTFSLGQTGGKSPQTGKAKKVAKEKKSPDWLTFRGTAEDKGQTYLLKADKAGGAIEIAKEYVKISGKSIKVKNGEDAKIISPPAMADKKAAGCVTQEDCPSKCCACIGLVRVCCGEGGTRGFCLGAWGCP
jgi:hypothetical protein